MKYRYVITNEGTVEADSEPAATTEAFQAMDDGYGFFTVEVEPLTKGEGEA